MSSGLLEFFSSPLFVSAVTPTRYSPRWITNVVFKLHMVTGSLVFLLSCFIFARELFGDHIHCIADGVDINGGKISQKAFDSFCYISDTFSLPTKKTVSYKGVGPFAPNFNEEVKFHNYYIWVPYLLFLQSISFFIPATLYGLFENYQVQILLADLQKLNPAPDDREDKYGDLTYYFKDWFKHQTWWASKLIFAEILNVVVIIINILLVDWYMSNQFLGYGIVYMNYIRTESKLKLDDPFNLIFPKMTKCVLKTFGPSGTIQVLDGLCVLPINVLNEKIFMILWFAFLLLSFITLIYTSYTVLLYTIRSLRAKFLVSYISPHRLDLQNKLEAILASSGFGDWMLLYMLARNTDKVIFSEIIQNVRHPDFNFTCEPTDIENTNINKFDINDENQ